MVMFRPLPYTSPDEALLLTKQRKQPENHRHARIQLHAHQPITDRVRDILEVHRFALDQDADGYDRVEGSLGTSDWCGRFGSCFA